MTRTISTSASSPRTPRPGRIIVSELKKDFTIENGDSFQIVLDTFHDQRNAYQFAINPAGAKWDAQMTNEGREVNQSWDGVWYVKSRVADDGWIAEIAIPFKTLKFPQSARSNLGHQLPANHPQAQRGCAVGAGPAHLQHSARFAGRHAGGIGRHRARREHQDQTVFVGKLRAESRGEGAEQVRW